jgi:hypothetical protein
MKEQNYIIMYKSNYTNKIEKCNYYNYLTVDDDEFNKHMERSAEIWNTIHYLRKVR